MTAMLRNIEPGVFPIWEIRVVQKKPRRNCCWRIWHKIKLHWKKYWEKINIDRINWENLFPQVKSIEKKYWEKKNIDTINWEKLFDRFAEHK